MKNIKTIALITVIALIGLTSCNHEPRQFKPLVFGVWEVEHRTDIFEVVNDSAVFNNRLNMYFVYDAKFNEYKPLRVKNRIKRK